jgi:formylglycine-generating enzyme required for sulfatase activity
VALEASELARVAPGDELVGLPPFERPDGGASCSPECAPDEACIAGTCRCGEGAGCGEGALCDEGACVPWPRSCDAVGRGVGCDVIDIPGGTFAMGSEDAYASGATGAFPVQPSITVGALRVDAYEVTVARFRRFWEAGHPAATSVRYPDGTTLPGGVVAEPLGVGTFECNWSAEPGARELHPVNCVEHAAALAFCAWDGGRLPTEAEWEWIARGRSVGEHAPGRVYPWGDVPQPEGTEGGACTLAQAFGCAGEDGAATRRVGSFDAVDGLSDLIGNVAEVTADHYDIYGVGAGGCWRQAARTDPLCRIAGATSMSVRGGGWLVARGGDDVGHVLYAAARLEIDAAEALDATGLRCVYPPR